MAQLAAQHQLQVLQVLDPIELSLPDAGVWLIDDYSEATAIKVNADDRVLKEQYLDAMQAHLADIESVFSACRIPFHRVHTNESFTDVLRRIGHA